MRTRIIEHEKKAGGHQDDGQFNACEEVYKELEGKIIKYAMKLDMYHTVQQMLKFHSKEDVMNLFKKIISTR